MPPMPVLLSAGLYDGIIVIGFIDDQIDTTTSHNSGIINCKYYILFINTIRNVETFPSHISAAF